MRKIYLLLTLIIANCALAQKTLFDIEPNNKPKTAQSFRGEHQLKGTLKDQDQDLFEWDLSDADADYFWDMELTGVPGRLTRVDIMKLEFNEEGKEVTNVHKLLNLKHNDGLDTVFKHNLLFSPGKYYFGLSFANDPSFKPKNIPLNNSLSGLGEVTAEEQKLIQSGSTTEPQNNYQLVLKKKKKINVVTIKSDSTQPTLVWKQKNNGFLMGNEEQWFTFKISEKESINNWMIKGRASVGERISLSLHDMQKNQIADSSSNSEGYYSFDGLHLAKGEYLIKTHSSSANHMASLSIEKTGVHVEGTEIEPNNYLETANQLNWNQAVSGTRNSESDVDYFKFSVAEQQSGNYIGIELQNPNQVNIELVLKDFTGSNLKQTQKAENITFDNIALAAGDYFIYIYRGEANATYEIQIKDLGKAKAGYEAEPNDSFKHATIMSEKRLIRGQFDGNEYDYYKFEVTGKPQLWTIQAIGTHITDINLYHAGGSSVQSMSYPIENKRARLSQLFLMPGTHVISLRGENGKYLLRAFATGEPDPNFEFEPNDDKSRSMLLKFGDIKKGILSEEGDSDFYRFSLENDEHVQLKVKPPEDGSTRYILSWFNNTVADKSSEMAQEMLFEGLLKAGDYYLSLRPIWDNTSDSAYKIELNRLPHFSCRQDCEPNDKYTIANQITETSFIKGRNKTHGDDDWYQLPEFTEETQIIFKSNNTEPSNYLRVYDKSNNKSVEIHRSKDANGQLSHYLIPAGVAPYIKVYGDEQDYDYSIIINQQQTSVDYGNDSDIEIQIHGIQNSVAAYHPQAQKLSGRLTLKNNSNQERQLKIKSTSSDFKWHISKLPENIKLTANQQIELPIEVIVAKQTIGMKSVRLSMAAIDEKNRLSETWHDIEVNGQINAVHPQPDWSLPEQLQGGLNVAALSLGSEIPSEEVSRLKKLGRGFDSLFNGYAFKGYGMIFRDHLNKGNNYITIKLAGSSAVDVVGFVLNPASDSNPLKYLKDFEIQLSENGFDFTTVLKDKIHAIDVEQAFVLPEKTSAKYARLYFLSNTYNEQKQNVGLGEWKVIAQPTQNISNGNGFNIADPKFGGYVAWSEPQLSGNWNIKLLKDDDRVDYVRSNNNKPWQWVIGFHNQRAAKIKQIQWQNPNPKSDVKTFKKVTISVSKESPTGPWEIVGDYDLPELDNTIELNQNVWARYVKFSVGNQELKKYFYPPQIIKIFEAPVSQDYLSLLGEWGELSQLGFYEKQHPPLVTLNPLHDTNNSKATAKTLKPSEQVFGQVQLEHSDKPDWYKYQVPANANTLYITLTGDPTVRTILSLEDQQGAEIPYTKNTSKIGTVIYQAAVEANQSYFVKIEEPPRSVIFSWDTSGSTSKYHGTIFQALGQFSEGVIPDRDTVNFLPFGNNLLMDQWYGEPYLLKTVLNNYDRKDGSSNAEKTLAQASKSLANRQGSKSIVLITDALTSSDQALWTQLRAVKPRIFSIGLIEGSASKTHENQFDLMQSWSRVNNGEFDKITTNADLGVAFDKAASKLRQPAQYGLQMNSEFLEAPGPGSLLITQDQQSSSTAVELILDASGSMLKRLNGQRRINIAKDVLIKTITDVLPENTPMALRVFGDQQANACRTDLRQALAPLNKVKAQAIINKVNAKNLAKTPIADSLAKVEVDLKKHQGKKVVILLTDGEETCEGDPEKVINELIEKGIDIRLNIVGFAINNEELKAEFTQWSEQGNGKYFDSNDPTSLKDSMAEALRIPYAVYTLTGELVAEGTVNGKALELPAGYYDIKIYGNEIITHSKYQIKGEVEQSIKL